MRNLKRALSLTLASIMLLGMMVVGSSAASYQDVTDEHNVEAIEVLQAVGIMVGDEGNFNPEKNVTRNEMAVIMSNLMDYRVATYAGTSPFTDVPSWAEPYVAACYTNGITSGTSATTYNGSGNVTTAQAALMVMKALGYFQTADDFKGDWQLATTRQANSIDLLVGVKAGVREAMTRNDVAQLVLNGLESGIVEVDSNNSVSVSVGEAQVNINGNKYVYVTSGQDYAHAIDRKLATANDGQYSNGFIVELGEKLYQGSLTKDSSTGYYTERNNFIEGNTDDFGRPADHWEYQGKAIGTYVIDPSVEAFTKKVTTKTLYNAVGSAACGYTWYVEVDGASVDNTKYGDQVSANKTEDNDCFLDTCGKPAGTLSTGNGTLTQVYVDGTNRIVHVSVIHYYAAEVLRINNADGADRSITLSNLDSSGPADTNDVFETENFTEDDVVAYSFAGGSIQEVYATERLEGKVTQARAREDENAKIKDGDHFTVDETKYNYNVTVPGAAPRRLTTENVNNNMVGYLDQFGYVIYIDDAAATYDYAYVLTMGSRTDDYGSLDGVTRANAADGKTWYARLVLTDGTMLKVETDAKTDDVEKLVKHLVSYSVDSKGVYSLISRSDGIGNGGVKIDTGAAGIKINDTNFVANNDTVFIIADSDKSSADDFNFRVYTGIKNVPDVESWTDGKTFAVAAKGANGVAKVVYIQDADVSGTKNVIFIKANAEAKFDKVTGSSRCYVLDAVEDGEVVTLRVKEGSEAAKKLVTNIAANFGGGIAPTKTNEKGVVAGIVAVEYLTRDNDDVVTNVKPYNTKYDPSNKQDEGYDVQTGTQRAERGTVGLGYSTRYGYSDSTIVVRYDVPSGDFYFEKNLNGIKDDADDVVIGIVDTGSLTGICYLNTTKTGAGEKPVDPEKPKDDEVKVTVTAANATVSCDGSAITGSKIFKKGADVTLNIAAAKGYEIVDVKVNGDTKGVVTSVSIPNIQANTTVEVITKAQVVTKTLTLTGILAEATTPAAVNPAVTVFAGTTVIPCESNEVVMVNGVVGQKATYKIPAGVEITVIARSGLDFTAGGKTFSVDGVNVTTVDASAPAQDKLTFTTNDNLTLNMTAKDQLKGANESGDVAGQVVVLKSVGGVTAEWAKGDDKRTLEANGTLTVPTGGALKVTDVGTGAKVITDPVKSATTYAKDAQVSANVTSNTTLTSATLVKTDAESQLVDGKGTQVVDASNTTVYVAVGTALKVEKKTSSDTWTGFVVSTDADVRHGASTTSFTVEGKDTYNVYGAYKLTLNEGVTATCNSKAVTSGDYVGANVTMTATDSTNTVVVDTTAKDTWYGAAVSGAQTLSKDTTYSALTKITLKANNIANLEYTAENGKAAVIIAGSTGDVNVGVAKDNKVTVNGKTKAAGTKQIELTGVEASSSAVNTTEAGAWAYFTVGDKAIVADEKAVAAAPAAAKLALDSSATIKMGGAAITAGDWTAALTGSDGGPWELTLTYKDDTEHNYSKNSVTVTLKDDTGAAVGSSFTGTVDDGDGSGTAAKITINIADTTLSDGDDVTIGEIDFGNPA